MLKTHDNRPPARAARHFGPRLAVEQHDLADACLIIARGDIDLGTAPLFRGALHEAVATAGATVVVDLTRVEFVDSTGLHLLLNALRRLTRQSRRLEIVCVDGAVRRTFETAGLDGTFSLRQSRGEALMAA